MRPRQFWWRFLMPTVVVAVGFGWLPAAISWLDKQGGFTQGVVLALILGVPPLLLKLVSYLWGRRKKQMESRRAARLAEDADFQRGSSELGIFDHGVISIEAFNDIGKGIAAALPLMWDVANRVLFSDVAKRMLAIEDAAEKAEISQKLARDIFHAVRDLERVAEAIQPKSTQMIAAYRVIFENDGPDNAENLIGIRDTFATGVEPFAKVTATCSLLRKQMAAVEGKQADLTRMVVRFRVALKTIEDVAEAVASFAATEMPVTINKILKKK